jgi:CheY-like chemotaxis protein/AraC-like DNA-binding protein
LLDLSKLESGKSTLEASLGNIVSFVKGMALSFESLSEEKDITLKILSEKDSIEVYFDREKMTEILSNILSNAFKFTKLNGKITISIAEKITDQVRNDKLKNSVEIKIRDTGIGIPQEEIPKLFDRFYQVDSSFTKEYQGTGIGLALTKELVELHHGSISVRSEKGNPANSGTGWTEFTLNFPLGRNHLKDEEIVKESEMEIILNADEVGMKNPTYVSDKGIYKEDSSSQAPQNDIVTEEDKTIILVVEDNYDMREYIKESLGEDYCVEEAVNGEQGVRKAENIIPDLIISDMMMPKMDGNVMTRILKNDEKTSHIPIIILTAKSGQESKLEGLETGADDYLTKPFDIKELQVRIKNLINVRRKLQEKFRNAGYVNTETEHGSQADKIRNLILKGIDEKFINKVLGVIDEHISEESLSVEEIGNEVGMSRAQFYRKIIALTGMSPRIYLRTIRLVKAKKMIEEKQGNISEIAFSVGFSSPSYFAKCFKDEFGYTPSDFIN